MKCFYLKYSLFIILLIRLLIASAYADSNRTSRDAADLYLMGLFLISSDAVSRNTICQNVVDLALQDINSREDLLGEYHLNLECRDSKCNAGLATNMMYEMLYTPPPKLMLLGAGCSPESQATAQASHLWNITQISYGSSSPALSNRRRFPRFFRVVSSEVTVNPARVQLMKRFQWNRVATIHESIELFSDVTYDLLKTLLDENITLITAEIFKGDFTLQLENLKRHDARIIVAGFYENTARKLFCQAYHMGFRGPKVVWFLPGWYGHEWWRLRSTNVPCTVEQMDAVAEGHILTTFFTRNPVNERSISGLTVAEWTEDMSRRLSLPDEKTHNLPGHCYDSVWALALALNKTDAKMKEAGHSKTLDEFTYADGDINDLITESMYEVSFKGIRGDVAFKANGETVSTIKIEHIQAGRRLTIGMLRQNVRGENITWLSDGIIWPGGRTPRDGIRIVYIVEHPATALYVSMCVLASLGILLCISFLGFNIMFRNFRLIKLSSPNINNIILLGCAVCYITVFLEGSEVGSENLFCKLRTILFTTGFSTAFGALFSKTWRVHKIFSNTKLKKVQIKDVQLLGLTVVLLIVDMVIIAMWEIVDPQYVSRFNTTMEISDYDEDTIIQYQVDMCESDWQAYFSGTLYAVNGILLAFGAFLAWETRHVKMQILNDSRYIGMSIYNTVILSGMGVLLSIALRHQRSLLYGLISGFTIIGVTLTQLLIFIPKVMKLKHGATAVESEFGLTTTNVPTAVTSNPSNPVDSGSVLMTNAQVGKVMKVPRDSG